jgi:transcriptional regulator with XRE-family HTH domain
MIYISDKIKGLRLSLGLSQAALSHEAGVSIPTIQSIEAGKANPSLETLAALAKCLGLVLELQPESPSWQGLIACGLPLSAADDVAVKPSLQSLKQELRRVVHQSLSQRESEAVAALLWAIEDHYPKLFAADFDGEAFTRFRKAPRVGRLVKLRRHALAVLSEYL